jgi:putative (di)nucleoside polyphosphate hydrolase
MCRVKRVSDVEESLAVFPNDEIQYRLNVAAILRNGDGRILIAERIDIEGAWQFPQGGVDPGETFEETLRRELVEELSVLPEKYIVREQKGPYRYVFGHGGSKKGCRGQCQHYFLADFIGTDEDIDVATERPEFRSFRWIYPEEFQLRWLPPMKRGVYHRVMLDFFEVRLRPYWGKQPRKRFPVKPD